MIVKCKVGDPDNCCINLVDRATYYQAGQWWTWRRNPAKKHFNKRTQLDWKKTNVKFLSYHHNCHMYSLSTQARRLIRALGPWMKFTAFWEKDAIE